MIGLKHQWGIFLLSFYPSGRSSSRYPFPSGIRLIRGEKPSLIASALGVNGFFTVIGSVLALLLSMTIGFQAVLWLASMIYLMSMLLVQKKMPAGESEKGQKINPCRNRGRNQN